MSKVVDEWPTMQAYCLVHPKAKPHVRLVVVLIGFMLISTRTCVIA